MTDAPAITGAPSAPAGGAGKKVFLHLGAHKTATTFIQRTLVHNRPYLRAQGWKVIYLQKDRPEVYAEVKRVRRSEDESEPANLFLQMLNKVRDGKANHLLTSETILGKMSVRGAGKIYPSHRHMIRLLKRGLGDTDVSVGFAVRNPGGYLESSYNWLVYNGATFDFAEYIERVDVDQLSWVPVVEHLIEAFGAEKVSLWTYEDFKAAPVEHIKKMIETAGAEASQLKIPSTAPVNVSYAPDVLPLASMWNRVLWQRRKELGPKKVSELRKRLRKLLQEGAPRSDDSRKHLLDKGLQDQCDQKYNQELTYLRRKWGECFLSV
ncbi:MAG TPA: hypothetical protein VF559_07635 [Caulobacteraceae bacterium]|jgi:hypothetical protein